MSEALVEVPNNTFFVPHPLTRDTCMIATLPAKRGAATPVLKIDMRASVGVGREHARFIPTCQASYGYTLDDNRERQNEWFERWLVTHKNVDPEALKQDEKRRDELDREFKAMEIQRVFVTDEKGEPNSFDFTVESVGPLPPRVIVERALEGIVKMCEPFMGLDTADLPETIQVTPCDAQMMGFDFIIQNQDHTFGNMIQTWLSDHHVEGDAKPTLSFAGYKIPHPLKDEMLLRIGVEDNNELTARQAIAVSARGCRMMFIQWLDTWTGRRSGAGLLGAGPAAPAPKTAAAGKRSIKLKKTAGGAGAE
jgi:DNA-directed RNA polymerase subunit L